MARASNRSAGLKTYWRTVHAVASRLDRSIADARAIVRAGRSRELTHTTIRQLTPQRGGQLLRADRVTRATTEQRPTGTGAARPIEPEDFGPESGIYDDLDRWIDEYGDYDEFDPPEDYDANPDYEGKKGK